MKPKFSPLPAQLSAMTGGKKSVKAHEKIIKKSVKENVKESKH